jgi:hypothetical protein
LRGFDQSVLPAYPNDEANRERVNQVVGAQGIDRINADAIGASAKVHAFVSGVEPDLVAAARHQALAFTTISGLDAKGPSDSVRAARRLKHCCTLNDCNMPKKGTWYEDTVADIAALLYQNATIQVRTRVEAPDGSREVDVEIRWEPILIANSFSWVDRKAPVDLPKSTLSSAVIDRA